jgi:hypothetical protein
MAISMGALVAETAGCRQGLGQHGHQPLTRIAFSRRVEIDLQPEMIRPT